MDASKDPRTREAWAAAGESRLSAKPTSRILRRLLAELDPAEVVLYLDVLSEGSRDVYLAVTPGRFLSWTPLTDRFRRMSREHVRVIDHGRTVNGVLRLSDGSSSKPMRLMGRPEQRSALLQSLRLPADAKPIGRVTLDLTTSPKTKSAYATSPLPPLPIGPGADAVLSTLGSSTAQLLVRATQVSVAPGLAGGDVTVVGSGTKIWCVPVGEDATSRLILMISRGSLRSVHAGAELTIIQERPARSTVALLRGAPSALGAVADQISRWAQADAATLRQRSEQEAKPVTRSNEQQTRRSASPDEALNLPRVRRSGFLGRKRSAPISNWQQAEAAACAWLRHMGFRDAMVTPGGADGGIDVTARKIVAQVKWEATPVGRPKLQQLHGAAAQAHKKGAFFSRSGYTTAALQWAEQAGIGAFVLLDDGSLVPATSTARKLLR